MFRTVTEGTEPRTNVYNADTEPLLCATNGNRQVKAQNQNVNIKNTGAGGKKKDPNKEGPGGNLGGNLGGDPSEEDPDGDRPSEENLDENLDGDRPSEEDLDGDRPSEEDLDGDRPSGGLQLEVK
jgi:hypothetical protein